MPFTALMAIVAIFVTSPFIQSSMASTVAPEGQPISTLTSGSISVPVYPTVNLTLDGTTEAVPLYLTGDGIRVKTVLFNFDVYTLVSYISTNPTTIDPTQSSDKILDAVRAAPTKLLQLEMLTDLQASDIRNAFRDALRDNNVSVTTDPIAGLLKQINFPFPTGMKINIVSYTKPDGTQIVQVEIPNQPTLSAQGPTLSNDFWKVWFATPDDSNLATLQTQLLNQIVKTEE